MITASSVAPRFRLVPDGVSSAGREAVELAAMAGLDLDVWQQDVLEAALTEKADGRWAAFEVGVTVTRQNGKGSILEARELAGLFLLGERLIIHSAHQFDTSLEAFNRLLFLIEQTPDLEKRVARVVRSHGEEGITLKNGQRIRFRTRTKGGGRGFSCDCLILDEAMIISEAMHGALLPTLSARPNPQVWYTGSPVDQLVHHDGVVFSRVRHRGMNDGDSLAYFEWSPDGDWNPSDVPAAVLDDPSIWAEANPAIGIRITEEHVAKERKSMDSRTFAVERLGIGDWPDPDPSAGGVFDMQKWVAANDAESRVDGPVWFAFDIAPDRGHTSIAAAGVNATGAVHVELVDRRPGTGWVADRLSQLTDSHEHHGVFCDGAGPAASLVDDLAAAGVHVEVLTSQEYAKACGTMFDLVEQGRVAHIGQAPLDLAVRAAVKRPLVDAWAWSRKSSTSDITPLVAGTIAAWKAAAAPGQQPWVLVW